MIDEFIESVLIPSIAILLQIIMICANKWLMERESEPSFVLLNCIIWFMIVFLTFPLILGMVLTVTSVWIFASLSLALMFFHLSMNIEFMLEYHKQRQKRRN